MNQLWFEDCLTVMRDDMNLGSVDLIYLDPPFNSNRAYNAIYKDATGRPLPEQIDAFCDMWTLDSERDKVIRAMPVLMREGGIDDWIARLWQLWMNALRDTQPRLLAYLSYMTQRLLRMKPLLKPTGTIYLHCDPTASHYIKILMDAIFGHQNFRNEIVWCYRGGGVPRHDFARKHDILLHYSRSEKRTFNVDAVRIPYSDDSSERLKYKARAFRPRKTYENYEQNPKGKHPEDWWEIQPIMPSSKERIGYPTQKPLALLERIILASSNEGDTVFDPFCGCATTLEVAHKLNRKWIGIDIAYHAIRHVVIPRLQDNLGLVEGKDFTVDGEPQTYEAAHHKWRRDPYHFQAWAISKVEGLPTTKRTGDGGIDGRLFFASPNMSREQSMTIEVKGGKNVGPNVVRALRGVLEADEAWMAGLILLHPLGIRKERNFRNLMAQAGEIDVFGVKYPRMQMLTVQQILNGHRFHAPSAVARGGRQGVLLNPLNYSEHESQ